MDKIKIKIDGRVAEIESAPEVVTDNAEYEVEFAVDERDGWNPAVPMTALFVRRDARYTAVVMDAGETICTMPPQTGTNIVYVGLTQDDMRTTTPAAIMVQRSIRTVANDPLPAPTEDVYAQILAAYAGIKILSGKGAPTSATQGKVNQLYRNEDTQKLYICTSTDGGYTWAAVVSDTEDAVTYTAQTLTEEQKTQARANIGAGTSNFSGSYNDLNDQPNIPAATVIDTTLSQSGQAADAKAAGDAIGKKLDKAQGVENAGMILGVDESGNVALEDKPVQALAGAAAPTTATVGVVGQEYYVIVDNALTEMYVCTSALNGSYTWGKVEFGAEESDPTVPSWAKDAQKPSYTASEVGADPSGTAASQVSAHNTGVDTHSDIRLLISGLTDRLNALADSDDTTLDQLSEVVAYIKSNRTLIEAITTSKVSVADIIDNLTTNATNKPLSAAQGVALKALIDAITIPEALPNPNALTFTGAVTGSYDGSAPLSVSIPSGGGGSGGSGKAKSQILIDQEITELTASLSVTLEHDFHNLTAIINCGSAGAALTAGSDGTAVASKIGLLIDTTDFGFNSRKVAYTDTSTGTWKNMMLGAEWSDSLSVFKRGFAVEIAMSATRRFYDFSFGGSVTMYGTLGIDDNAPRTGRTANIVVKSAYLNVGTRVVLWGEYYE